MKRKSKRTDGRLLPEARVRQVVESRVPRRPEQDEAFRYESHTYVRLPHDRLVGTYALTLAEFVASTT